MLISIKRVIVWVLWWPWLLASFFCSFFFSEIASSFRNQYQKRELYYHLPVHCNSCALISDCPYQESVHKNNVFVSWISGGNRVYSPVPSPVISLPSSVMYAVLLPENNPPSLRRGGSVGVGELTEEGQRWTVGLPYLTSCVRGSFHPRE